MDPLALQVLQDAGIPTHALTDVVELDPSARDHWEPLLAPWRGALLIGPSDRDVALAVAPSGTVLVIEDSDDWPLPQGVRAPVGVRRFLATLQDRSAPPLTDSAAGVVVVGGFAHELCGRDAAIQRAQAEFDEALARHGGVVAVRRQADEVQELAAQTSAAVRAREAAVRAQAKEQELQAQLAEAVEKVTLAKEAEAAARTASIQAEAALLSHGERRDSLTEDLGRLQDSEKGLVQALQQLEDELRTNNTDAWRSEWGSSDAAAADLLAGDDRVENTFRRRAAECLTDALVRIGVDIRTGHGAPTAAIEEVIRTRHGLDEETAVGPEHRRFDIVVRPLVDWLDDLATDDASFRDEIEAERSRWNASVDAATRECEEQQANLDLHRDMVSSQLEVAFEAVSARYTELDQAAGGYGARLAVRNTPPQTATDLWTWEVTPEWRRAPGGRFVPYTRQANSAMQKQHRTHLVLAALLASENPAGRVLIIDEAGNDFGREHLRQVLSAFARVASTQGVTVIAACQDKVLEEVAALGDARMLLWFERLSDASPLCRPARVWGFDPERGRVELTRPAVEDGRVV